jgi:hypothetical protein
MRYSFLNIQDQSGHPFSIRITSDLLNGSKSRWVLCEGDRIVIRSPHSYVSRREAEAAAEQVMGQQAQRWYVNRD